LGNPGQAQPAPLGRADYQPRGLDLTTEQCQQMTAFISALPRPVETVPPAQTEPVGRGRQLFHAVGCAACHVANMGSIEGVYSDFLLHRMGPDFAAGGSYYGAPSTPSPGSLADAPMPDEWRTPPLWGVADSAPYLHDGRAATLADAIKAHGGQAQESARRYAKLSPVQQQYVLQFLKSLRAPG
jgi:CxxC motif-containing protein (DUF1111 family)